MLKRSLRYSLLFLAALSLGCPTNPSGPVLEPPGVALLYDSNFNSIQLNGDFMPGADDGWDALDPRHEMTLVDDFQWEITASITASELTENPPVVMFKFTHDNLWSPDNFSAGGEPGQAELGDGGDDILLEISEGQGFYTITFDDETLRYGTQPTLALGEIGGTVDLDGDEPSSPLEVTLFVQSAQGEAELWSVEPTRGPFAFTALADSLYTLRFAAGGYASTVLADIRVEGGVAPAQNVVLNQVFGAISGTVTFSDDPTELPTATVTATDTLQVIAGTATTDEFGAYVIEGLSAGTFDLRFTAQGYSAGELLAVTISGDGEEPGHDVTLDPSPFATPDPPYFTAVIDGTIDVGWDPEISDPVDDSDWGSLNDFHGLYVAWDDEKLYIAVSGSFDSDNNTVNVYIDEDFGAGTGISDFSVFGSDPPFVGDHLRKNIDMSGVSGYGAEFAGSVWGQIHQPEVSDFVVPEMVTPLEGSELLGSGTAIEFSVPWLSIYPDFAGGIPPLATLGIYCVIGGGNDISLASDTLPPVANPFAPDAVFTIQVDSDER